MAVIDQLGDLMDFAKGLPSQDLGSLSLEEVINRWRLARSEDVVAIQESLNDYDRGERGQPVEEFLAEFRAGQGQDGGR